MMLLISKNCVTIPKWQRNILRKNGRRLVAEISCGFRRTRTNTGSTTSLEGSSSSNHHSCCFFHAGRSGLLSSFWMVSTTARVESNSTNIRKWMMTMTTTRESSTKTTMDIAKMAKDKMERMLPEDKKGENNDKDVDAADASKKESNSGDGTLIGTPQFEETARQQQLQMKEAGMTSTDDVETVDNAIEDNAAVDGGQDEKGNDDEDNKNVDEFKDCDFYFPKPHGLPLDTENIVLESHDKKHAIYRCNKQGITVIHCSLGWIVRHGPSDGVVEVNVGGKTFQTLRSTIVSSRVLAELYANAKLYQRHGDKDMLFIDRDAATFHLILTYLRNRLEDLSHASALMNTPASLRRYIKKEKFVSLPQDNKVLRDVYLEAVFFGLEDFQADICSKSLFIKFSSTISGGKNPFDQLNEAIKTTRRVAVSASLLAGGHLSTGGQLPEFLQPVVDVFTKVFPS